MKRFMLLALSLALVMGLVANASATEFKVKGQLDAAASWTDNTNFSDSESDAVSEETFEISQRLRTSIDIIASENVMAQAFFEIGDVNWGNGAGALGTDAIAIETRRLYLDFTVPNTALDVRLGLQGLALPGIAGSPIFDTDCSGLIAQYAFNDMVSLAALWIRAADANLGTDGGVTDLSADDEIDVLAAILPISLDGVSLNPFFAYIMAGNDSAAPANLKLPAGLTEEATGFWFGTDVYVSAFDPFAIMLDFQYGAVEAQTDNEAAGWYGAIEVDYKMDAFTPGILFFYATGEDDDATNGSERMPSISPSWTPTSFGFDGGGFGTAGGVFGVEPQGLWGFALLAKNFSFIEGLSHTARFAYAVGTNDEASGMAITEEDSVLEFNLDSSYALYESLSAWSQIGYAQVDADEDVHGADFMDEAAWKFALGLKYSF